MINEDSKIALFWDYENVPIRWADWRQFIPVFKNFMQSHSIVFANYFLKDNLPLDDDWEILQLVQGIKLKKCTGSILFQLSNINS